MATASTLSISVSNLRLIAGSSKLANPISSSSSKPSSFPLSSYPSSSSLSKAGSLGSVSTSRRRLVELGIGLLAFSAPMLDANATRIEYYATVGEPLCDLNFVKSGLVFCDVAVGNGVQVHYTARFADGTVFDGSYKRGRPLTMRIGVGKVLPGLDQGILGGGGVPPMHVGGKRKLFIPPKLAYGPEPAGCFSGDCLPTLLCFMTFSLLEFTNNLDDLGKCSWWMKTNTRTRTINKIYCFCACAKA